MDQELIVYDPNLLHHIKNTKQSITLINTLIRNKSYLNLGIGIGLSLGKPLDTPEGSIYNFNVGISVNEDLFLNELLKSLQLTLKELEDIMLTEIQQLDTSIEELAELKQSYINYFN